MITGKDLEGWLTAPNPQEAMASTLRQKELRERRERIATAALAALLSNQENPCRHDIKALVIEARRHADAMIAELDAPRETKP